MKLIDYKCIDKTLWARGPWDGEPDKRQWTDEATGLPCLIVRGNSGALCGYVGVRKDHPAYGKAFYAISVDAQWQLSYSCWDRDNGYDLSICHGGADAQDIWWLGFCCGQAGSRENFLFGGIARNDGAYKCIDSVAAEVRALATELKAMESTAGTGVPVALCP